MINGNLLGNKDSEHAKNSGNDLKTIDQKKEINVFAKKNLWALDFMIQEL